eukprot:2689012-Alexandrium_andersonii.AAC.1
MSASLVGSEMCIRDRPWVFSFTPMIAHALPAQCALRLALPPASSRLPVSYTHLTLPTICSV